MSSPLDVWGKLWDLATDDPDTLTLGPATIEVDPEDSGCVTLVWPNGSRAGVYWDNGRWNVAAGMNTVAGDVAARDAL